MKNRNEYIAIGAILVLLGIYILKAKKDFEVISNDFVGASKKKVFENPYTKARDGSGYSQLYRLSQFFSNPTRVLDNFQGVEVFESRVLNGKKYSRIDKEEWIETENLVFPKG